MILSGIWKPLWHRDSEKIEKIYQIHGTDSEFKVCIRNSHSMAHIKERVVADNYNNAAHIRKLIRGTWFWEIPENLLIMLNILQIML